MTIFYFKLYIYMNQYRLSLLVNSSSIKFEALEESHQVFLTLTLAISLFL